MGEPADPEIRGDNGGVTCTPGDKDRDLNAAAERQAEGHASCKDREVTRDSSLDESDNRHMKKKKKKRHRSRSRCASFNEPGSATSSKSDAASAATAEGGQHDTDESDGDEDAASVVVSSSTIRKKKSRSSSRHRHRTHKKADSNVPDHDDSGLSLGNSLNGSSTANVTNNEIADGTAAESINTTANSGETLQELREKITMEKPDDVHVHGDFATTVPKRDDACNMENYVSCDDRKVNDVEKNATITDSANMPVDSSLLHDNDNVVTETALSQGNNVSFETPNESAADSSSKVKKTREVDGREGDCPVEGEMLKGGSDDTRGTFEEEDRNVSEQRQQHTPLPRLPGHQGGLHAPIGDVAKLEEELESRFKECMEQQAEIEEMERYLNMRESLCKSKEKDIAKLDDELDAWQGELDIKKKQLEMEDNTRRRIEPRACTSSNHPRPTTDEEDYILKKNLLKSQADLARSEEENATLHKELDIVKEHLASSEAQRRNQDAKIKQLETQLTIALQQINENKTSHAHRKGSPATLPPITNGHRLSHAPSTSTLDRVDELKRERERERSHIMLQRLNSSNQQLSINQEAALRRKLSGKDGPSSSKLQQSDRGVGTVYNRKASSSEGSAHSGERGSSSSRSRVGGGNGSPARSDVTMETETSLPASSPERRKQALEKSSVCVVM